MDKINISYVGDKPVISPNGVYFNHSKPDKYIYLQAITHIINALLNMGENEDYIEHFDLSKKFSDAQILDLLYKLQPDFNRFYGENIENYIEKIKEEEEEIDIQKSGLSDLERDILKNNYHLMFDYRIQRAKNKLVYEKLVDSAVQLILQKRVSKIKAVSTREFFHVLTSIKTTIESKRNAPDVSLQFIDRDDKEVELELNIKFPKHLES